MPLTPLILGVLYFLIWRCHETQHGTSGIVGPPQQRECPQLQTCGSPPSSSDKRQPLGIPRSHHPWWGLKEHNEEDVRESHQLVRQFCLLIIVRNQMSYPRLLSYFQLTRRPILCVCTMLYFWTLSQETLSPSYDQLEPTAFVQKCFLESSKNNCVGNVKSPHLNQLS